MAPLYARARTGAAQTAALWTPIGEAQAGAGQSVDARLYTLTMMWDASFATRIASLGMVYERLPMHCNEPVKIQFVESPSVIIAMGYISISEILVCP